MNTVKLEVCSREETNRRFLRAFEGEVQEPVISFESASLLFKVLTQKRWELLRVMESAGPASIREIARRAGRDVKAVHGDVQALLKAGVIDKTGDGKIVFPYDAIHVDFMLQAA
jgi:predicted transcriptional regulator